MNIAPMIVHGWKFEFDDSQLLISTEDDSQQLRLNARAAYSLLGYLYQYRDDVHTAAAQAEDEQVEQQKEEHGSAHGVDVAQSE
ncbi:MAG TPA: hypothetical protein VJO32_00060 [Ktedonobacteraceae bacterium]|nr:hypothetical protein [Ktedonobacteraceae bacterium]